VLAALEAAVGPVQALQRSCAPVGQHGRARVRAVELADGTTLALVLKSGGRDTPHEVAVYRDVLAAADLGTPRLVAASAAGAGWLLVDALPAAPLWQSADVGSWCAAARQLAVGHDRLAGLAPQQRPAAGTAYEVQLERAERRDPRAADLRGACAAAADALRAAPTTVLHGEAFPSNVLLGPTGAVCLVDWETAGAGPGLLDLAALCIGWPPDDAARIAAAYAEALDAGSAADPLALLPAARLLVAVRWLGEPQPAPGAGGGHARRTDWWAQAAAAAELLP
jgi:aminoglycoside phosphotransferase